MEFGTGATHRAQKVFGPQAQSVVLEKDEIEALIRQLIEVIDAGYSKFEIKVQSNPAYLAIGVKL